MEALFYELSFSKGNVNYIYTHTKTSRLRTQALKTQEMPELSLHGQKKIFFS